MSYFFSLDTEAREGEVVGVEKFNEMKQWCRDRRRRCNSGEEIGEEGETVLKR